MNNVAGYYANPSNMQIDSNGDIIAIVNGSGGGGGTGTSPLIYVTDQMPTNISAAILSGTGYSGDVSSYIQAAITLANTHSNGATVYFPGGNYNVGNTLNLSPSSTGKVVNFKGDGSGNTILTCKVSNGTLLTCTWPIVGNWIEGLIIEGMTFVNAGSSNATCMAINGAQWIGVIDVAISAFTNGGTFENIVGGTFNRLLLANNHAGLSFLQPGGGAGVTTPNEISFIDCHGTGGAGYFFQFHNCANIIFLGGSMEEFNDVAGSPLQFLNGVVYGTMVCYVSGVHFETNQAISNILITGSTFLPMIYTITGCDFFQNGGVSSPGIVTNHINITNPSSGAQMTVNVSHNGFGGFSYTPNAGRLNIVTAGPSITVNTFANNYAYAVEIPFSGNTTTMDGTLNLNQATQSLSVGGTILAPTSVTTGSVFCSGVQSFNGDIMTSVAGFGLKVAEGTNGKQGVVTLTGGAANIVCTSVTSTSRIFLTAQDSNSVGALRVNTITPGSGFSIASSGGTDHGVVAYQIFG